MLAFSTARLRFNPATFQLLKFRRRLLSCSYCPSSFMPLKKNIPLLGYQEGVGGNSYIQSSFPRINYIGSGIIDLLSHDFHI